MPSAAGRWNALRPLIKPMPPARLLMTAVRTGASVFRKIFGRNHKEPRVRVRGPAEEAKVR